MADEFKKIVFDKEKIKEARRSFFATGKVKRGAVRDEILESWRRCKAYGVDPNLHPNPKRGKIVSHLSEEEKNEIFAANRTLIDTARPLLEKLFKTVSEGLIELFEGLGLLVYLTDKHGVILYSIGEGYIWEYSRGIGIFPGVSLNEKYAGTNPLTLAIALDRPYHMIAEEHYCSIIKPATCAAAPIHDEDGEIIGALDITTSYKLAQKHPFTVAMILEGAKVIESHLRLQKELDKSFLANQYLNAASESMEMCMLILDHDNIITHSNQAAEKILGMGISGMENKKIDDIIANKDILNAIHEKRTLTNREVILGGKAGARRCLVRLRPIFDTGGKVMGHVLFLEELARVQKMVQKLVGLEAQYTFQDIWGESEEIKAAIEVAKTIAKGTGNVIITGESGTGKELFAQSIHNASLNFLGPFLGINCATIPNDLIESELFGYEAGTFTGGLREGRSGKLEMANGGTLFLDEINGMSLDMQVKLLRVLEEKKFLRLGGKSYFKLESRIITATNKDLKEEIKGERFRSDLYYRLSIFEIHIPPLRERKGDIKVLANMFLCDLCVKTGKKIDRISPEAMAYLENYQWPGNVRELKNWIERALFFAKGSYLTLDDFPQDSPDKTRAEPPHPSAAGEGVFSLDDMEMNTIKLVLDDCRGNISQACKRLGIGRTSLYRKLHKYDLHLSKIFSSGTTAPK